jgi:RND family efflux transporter MFP subunit
MKTRPSLLLTAAAGLAAAACGSTAQTAGESPRAVPVRTATVEQRPLEELLVLTGTLRPRSQVQIVAEVSARLLRLDKDEGGWADKGDTLAELDDTDLRLAHERALAALAVAEANKAHAIVEKERADNLLKTGGITDKDHLAAQVNLQVAEASLAQARAEAAIAGQQHDRARIKAPFAGRVAKRLADPGSMLAAGAPLFTFVDDSVLEFRAAVPSAEYSKARVGAPVDVTVDAVAGTRARGRVARIAPLVDERTRAFEVVVEVPGGKNLVGGLFARASVQVGRVEDAVVVPPASLLRSGATPAEADVFVVTAGKVEKRTVALGIEGASAIQVTKGLAAWDVVVLDPPASLGSGAAVEVAHARQ